jgi:hypothetical protein
MQQPVGTGLAPRLSAPQRAARRAGLLALLACLAGSLAQTDDDERRSHNAPHEHAEAWIEQGGFVLLVVALFEMFYGLATVVEEFFVPALNIMVRQSLIQLHRIIFMLRCFALTNCIYVHVLRR